MTLAKKKRYKKMFNPDKFMRAMIRLGEMYKEEVKTFPYRVMCFQECHNAVAWMALQLKRSGLKDSQNFYIVTGSYKATTGWFSTTMQRDHSWIEYHGKGGITIFDLTLQQFKGNKVPRLYVGKITSCYNSHVKLNLYSEELQDHLLSVG